MGKKRIAIQLFGHLRTFEQTYRSLYEHIIFPNNDDSYEVDIFIHTWNELQASTVSYYNPDGDNLVGSKLSEDNINFFNSIYKPKKYLIEPQLGIEDKVMLEKVSHNIAKRSLKGTINFLYTQYKVNLLRQEYEKETGVKYDWVITTRPDVMFFKDFKIDKILEKYNKYSNEEINSVIFCPHTKFSFLKVYEERLIAGLDIVFFATPDIMDKATSLYKKLDKQIDPNNFYNFEALIVDFWKSENIDIRWVNYSASYNDFLVVKNDDARLKSSIQSQSYKEKKAEIENKLLEEYKIDISKNKKRIAIQLFGNLRTFQRTYKSFFKNVVEPNQNMGYEVDIFIHTWNKLEHPSIVHHNQIGEQILKNNEVSELIIKKIKSIYKPKGLIIDNTIPKSNNIISSQLGNSISEDAFYSFSQTLNGGSKLREEYEKTHDIKYDYVIVTRPDIQFFSPFSVYDFISGYDFCLTEIPSNALFYGNNDFSRGDVETTNLSAGTDLIFFAKPNNISKATQLTENWQEIIKNDGFYCFEVLLMRHWKKQGLKPMSINYHQGKKLNFEILRSNATRKRLGLSELNTMYKVKLIRKKIKRGLLKLLPYFMVRKKIDNLEKSIKMMKGQ